MNTQKVYVVVRKYDNIGRLLNEPVIEGVHATYPQHICTSNLAIQGPFIIQGSYVRDPFGLFEPIVEKYNVQTYPAHVLKTQVVKEFAS